MARRTDSSTTLSSRGIGMLATGIVVGGLGVGLATSPLVYIGIAMVSAVLIGVLWMLFAVNSFLSSFPFARREVAPRPLTVGVGGTVTVTISAASRGRSGAFVRRALADALDIREQAAAELTGGGPTKATVTRSEDKLTLSYSLQPVRRGRWPLGPALVHSSDPLGMIWADTSVGDSEHIPVWPAVVDLSGTAGALMGHADRIVLGARTPSADDAALRDYREGDDLRRVHWPSSARKGTMLVRSDERAGRRPATVLLDLPREPHALEWSISAAASIALSVLDSGHPVRLLGGTIDPDRLHHLGNQHAELARATLLDLTVDLHSAATPSVAHAQLLAAIRHLADDKVSGEVIVAVLEAPERATIEALAPLGESGRAWAIVRTPADDSGSAQESVTALRRTGWRATSTSTGADIATVWGTLIALGDVG